jgi:hypothetical protein
VATHYKTLGVRTDASTDEVRKAYLSAARQWHPDRFAGRPPLETQQAEDRMRKLNEAWAVLGDSTSRRRYDLDLANVSGGATTVGEAVRSDGGVTRIDPRLLDPEFLASRRRLMEEDTEVHHSNVVRVITVLGFFGLLAGIFIFTAYANGSSGTAPAPTVPGPDLGIGVEAGECVRQMSGGSLLVVPCDGTTDGRVIGARQLDGTCPVSTVRELLLPNDLVVCLGQ